MIVRFWVFDTLAMARVAQYFVAVANGLPILGRRVGPGPHVDPCYALTRRFTIIRLRTARYLVLSNLRAELFIRTRTAAELGITTLVRTALVAAMNGPSDEEDEDVSDVEQLDEDPPTEGVFDSTFDKTFQ